MRYARAAFIGDVRIPFVTVIVLSAVFATGWLAASHFQGKFLEEQRLHARAQGALDSNLRMLRIMSRHRDDPEEQEAYIRVSDEMRRLIVEATMMDVPPEVREDALKREGYIKRQAEYKRKREAEREAERQRQENSDEE